MEVDALSKGGKSKSGKGNSVICWIRNNTGHLSRNRFFNKGNGKGKGKFGQCRRMRREGCFNCGGNHFARDCIANQGGKPVGKEN